MLKKLLILLMVVSLCACSAKKKPQVSAPEDVKLSKEDPEFLRKRASKFEGAQIILQLKGKGGILSPQGNFLAYTKKAGKAGKIEILDLSKAPPTPLSLGLEGLLSAAFSNDNESVWLGSASGSASQVELPSGSLLQSVDLEKDTPLEELLISTNGKYLAWFNSKKGKVGVFDIEKKKEVVSFKGIRPARFAPLQKSFSFSPDSRFFIAGQKKMILWNLENSKGAKTIRRYTVYSSTGVSFAKGALFYGTKTDKKGPYSIQKIDLNSLEETIFEGYSQEGYYLDLFISPSQRFLTEGDYKDAGIRIYDLNAPIKKPVTFDDKFNTLVGWDSSSELVFLAKRRSNKKGVGIWNPYNGERLTSIQELTGKGIRKIEIGESSDILIANQRNKIFILQLGPEKEMLAEPEPEPIEEESPPEEKVEQKQLAEEDLP